VLYPIPAVRAAVRAGAEIGQLSLLDLKFPGFFFFLFFVFFLSTRLPVRTRVPHREGNSMEGLPS